MRIRNFRWKSLRKCTKEGLINGMRPHAVDQRMIQRCSPAASNLFNASSIFFPPQIPLLWWRGEELYAWQLQIAQDLDRIQKDMAEFRSQWDVSCNSNGTFIAPRRELLEECATGPEEVL